MFQFFNVLSKFHRIDEDFFVNCAVGVSDVCLCVCMCVCLGKLFLACC